MARLQQMRGSQVPRGLVDRTEACGPRIPSGQRVFGRAMGSAYQRNADESRTVER